jgi:hypothetical protein
MIKENLDRVLNDVDLNHDKPAWLRFREWLESFHELNTAKLVQFSTFSEFDKIGEIELPLKYFESIRDLWIKWSKAVEADIVANSSI